MELITILLAAATYYVISEVLSIGEYLWNNLIFTISQPAEPVFSHSDQYQPDDIDRKYIDATVSAVHDTIGENAVDQLLAMDAQNRIKAVNELTERLKILYDLQDIDIVYAEDKKSSICGYYNDKENKIVLNCAHLLTNNKVLVRDFLDTIFHEFRHAVQWKMVRSQDSSSYIWYNGERVKGFADNLTHYISANEDPKGYHYQCVEMDAREIALYIVEGI